MNLQNKFDSPLLNLNQHYQAKGKGPIFVFLLIGIALLVSGFGYLALLLVGKLGAGSKTLLLFVVAIGITLGGAYLARRDQYPEISSDIFSLGLLLNFVTVYIAGSFYQLFVRLGGFTQLFYDCLHGAYFCWVA